MPATNSKRKKTVCMLDSSKQYLDFWVVSVDQRQHFTRDNIFLVMLTRIRTCLQQSMWGLTALGMRSEFLPSGETLFYSAQPRHGCHSSLPRSPVIPLLEMVSPPLILPLLFSELYDYLLLLDLAITQCVWKHRKGNVFALSPCI